MLVVMHATATAADIERVCGAIIDMGYQPIPMPGAQRTTVGLVGNDRRVDGSHIEAFPGVAEIIYVSSPFKQVSREWRSENTTVTIAPGVTFGGRHVPVVAGPCSVESEKQILQAAQMVRDAGAVALRGGAFKPRSSPYAFQGMGEAGLELLAEARARTGMPVVTEVMDPRQVELVARYADVLQIGARNMQNFALLSEVGRVQRPVLLKRGLSGTITELLMAAEYVLAQGNGDVMLCERGIRTYETATRNTLDVAAIPVLKRETHLPVLVDPSHAGGRAHLVTPLALAAVAAGADGLIVEVHPDPAHALSDGEQSLEYGAFGEMMTQVRAVAEAVGRRCGWREGMLA